MNNTNISPSHEEAAVNRKNNIVLIGYMGAGKTTVGRKLSEITGMRFIDTDDMIVKQMNLSVNDIFDKYGEVYFRELETKLIKTLAGSVENCIISCGGGMPVREENRKLLRELGTVFYLSVNENDILRRLKNDKKRPLLRGDKDEVKKRIHDMLNSRDPVYSETAHVTVKTGRLNITEVIERIMGEYENTCN